VKFYLNLRTFDQVMFRFFETHTSAVSGISSRYCECYAIESWFSVQHLMAPHYWSSFCFLTMILNKLHLAICWRTV